MNPIATYAAKSFAILSLSLATPAVSENTKLDMGSSVRLICDGASADPICKALSEALRAVSKDNSVETAQADEPDLPPADMTIRFVETLNTPDALSGQLEWETLNGVSGSGPVIELSIMDTVRTQKILNAYAMQLVELSDIPL